MKDLPTKTNIKGENLILQPVSHNVNSEIEDSDVDGNIGTSQFEDITDITQVPHEATHDEKSERISSQALHLETEMTGYAAGHGVDISGTYIKCEASDDMNTGTKYEADNGEKEETTVAIKQEAVSDEENAHTSPTLNRVALKTEIKCETNDYDGEDDDQYDMSQASHPYECYICNELFAESRNLRNIC